ncbi:MAG: response regulator transcription factor [Acidimicrobiales bacterium]
MRILVVDDEPDLADAVASSLRREGYAVDVSYNGQDALERLSINPYDLVLLDLTLPDLDGLEICRTIRTDPRFDPTTRILMVTARDSIEERVQGLDDGADDYLIKPFALRELSARVRTLLRRETTGGDAVLLAGELALDTARQLVSWQDNPIELTTKELSLLRYFMTHEGEVLSQERLLEHVWDEMLDPFTNTARVTVGTLRRKLSAATGHTLIETVIGAGYKFVPPSQATVSEQSGSQSASDSGAGEADGSGADSSATDPPTV